MVCVTSGAGIAYPFGASEFIAGFGEIHVAIYSFLCSGLSLLCPSFAHCAVHRFMLSDYPFGIVKLFLVLVLDLMVYMSILGKVRKIVRHSNLRKV
jgi:hypothetical protein